MQPQTQPSAPGTVTSPTRIGELPGPRTWFGLSHAWQFDLPRLHQQLEGWEREHGAMFKLRLGGYDALAISAPELIAAVLRDRPTTWSRMGSIEPVMREMGANGLFSAERDDWRRQRRLVMGAFDPTHLRRFFPSLMRVTGRLQSRWARAAGSGAAMDLQAELMRYTVDVTAGLAFGVDMNTLEESRSELHEHLDKVFPMLNRRLNMPFAYWRYLRLPIDRAFDRHLAAVHVAIRELVAAARGRLDANPERRTAPTDLLEALLVARDTDGSGLSEGDVVGNVFTVLLGGEDTTANSLAWAIYLLRRHPEAWRKLVAEADAVLGAAALPQGIEQAGALPYTDACIQEAMRLHPVAPMLVMQARRHTRLRGLAVPRGTLLFCLMRPGAVDATRLAEAAAFRPERWLAASEERPQADDIRRPPPVGVEQSGRATFAQERYGVSPKKLAMPFGAGPRLCPGRYLAMLEMRMVLGMLARNFELVEAGTADGSPPTEKLAFAMSPVGLRMRLAVRKH